MVQKFDFWKDHSDTFLTMAYLWERRRVMENPDGYGKKTGDCGDTITMYLSVNNGVIDELNFELDGCLNTNACSNGLAMLIEGRKIEHCWEVTSKDLITYLDTLPEDHHHCAELAVGTFYLALADYNVKKS